MTHETVIELVSAACPWLVVVWCLEGAAVWSGWRLRGWGLLSVTGALSLGVLLVPVDGIVIARHVAGISASVSMPLTGMLAVAVWERAFGRRVLSQGDWTAGWVFGALGGLALYPLALGLGSFDPYEWGWRFSPLFAVVGALTAWLVWKQNRFGVVLLLAIAAFHLRLLESTNYWDYLLDPVYCLVSFIALGRLLGGQARAGTRLPREVP